MKYYIITSKCMFGMEYIDEIVSSIPGIISLNIGDTIPKDYLSPERIITKIEIQHI